MIHITASSCFSDTTIKTITVTITEDPVTTNDTVCKGSSATLLASGIGTLEWYDVSSGGTVINTGNSYTTPALNNTTTYFVQAVMNGCSSNRVPVTAVVVSDTAVANFSFNIYDNSEDVPVDFINNSTGTSISWNFGDGSAAVSSSADTVNHTYTLPGYYNVTVIASNCLNTDTLSQIIYIIPKTYSINDCNCIIPFAYSYIDRNIDTTATWNTNRTIKGTLTIKPGKILTVSAGVRVDFGPQGNVIVMPGGTLIIDGAIFGAVDYSSTCGSPTKRMWQGIQVLGVRASNLASQQGKVVLKNNATIEDAHNGVVLGQHQLNLTANGIMFQYEGHQLSKGGGIIDATNSNFNRNGTSVKFFEYSFINKGKIISCNFKCEASGSPTDLLNPYYNFGSAQSYDQAALRDHNPFYTFPFTGLSTLPLASGRSWISVFGYGIRSLNNSLNTFDNTQNGFKLTDCNLTIHSSNFSNVGNGIYMNRTLTSLTGSTIRNNEFQDFQRGVSIHGISSMKIYENIFNDAGRDQLDNLSGIAMHACPSYNISDNEFKLVYFPIYSDNKSGMSGRTIGYTAKGNIFTRCYIPIDLKGDHRGLNVKCNLHDNPVSFDYKINWIVRGSLLDQGQATLTNPKAPAGNRFFPFSSPGNKNQLFANTTFPLMYYRHNDLFTEPIPSSFSSVPSNYSVTNTGVAFDNENTSCAPIIPPWRLSSLDSGITKAKQAIAILESEFNLVSGTIDHGQTAFLLSAIAQSPPPGNLKTLLISNSPLSDTVLSAYLTAPYNLPAGNVKEVMEPNMPLSDKVYPKLQNILLYSPAGVRTDLEGRQLENPGYRTLTAIRREIDVQESNKLSWLIYLVNHYSEVDSMQLAVLKMENESLPEIKKSVAASYIESNDIAIASLKLSQVPATDQDETDYKELYNMYISLAQAGKTLWDLDQRQKAIIERIASVCPTSLAGTNAKGILALVYGEIVPECVDSESSARLSFEEFTAIVADPQKNISKSWLGNNVPNPFQTITVIPYLLPQTFENAEILITDVMGRSVKNYSLKNGSGMLEVSLEGIQSGVYFYSIRIDGNVLQTKRMVVNK